jgi:hypothetical protein
MYQSTNQLGVAMARLSKAAKEQKLEAERLKFYKHWHDQYRRNSKYSEWTREKKLGALKRRMAKYDREKVLA